MTSPPTPEEQLVRVIEAMGGCADCLDVTDGNLSRIEWQGETMPVIGLLLMDPEALQRAFGNQPHYCSSCLRPHEHPSDCDAGFGTVWQRWFFAAHQILDAYLSSPGCDPVAAVATAFDLLPPHA